MISGGLEILLDLKRKKKKPTQKRAALLSHYKSEHLIPQKKAEDPKKQKLNPVPMEMRGYELIAKRPSIRFCPNTS